MTAEEILDKHTSDMKGLLDFGNYAFVAVPYANAIKAMKEYAEQRIREELIKYSAWGYGSDVNNPAIIADVDEYLKQKK